MSRTQVVLRPAKTLRIALSIHFAPSDRITTSSLSRAPGRPAAKAPPPRARPFEGIIDDLPSRAKIEIQAGDVLIAINISSRGTVVLVPEDHDGTICTSGFRVIRPQSPEHGKIL